MVILGSSLKKSHLPVENWMRGYLDDMIPSKLSKPPQPPKALTQGNACSSISTKWQDKIIVSLNTLIKLSSMSQPRENYPTIKNEMMRAVESVIMNAGNHAVGETTGEFIPYWPPEKDPKLELFWTILNNSIDLTLGKRQDKYFLAREERAYLRQTNGSILLLSQLGIDQWGPKHVEVFQGVLVGGYGGALARSMRLLRTVPAYMEAVYHS